MRGIPPWLPNAIVITLLVDGAVLVEVHFTIFVFCMQLKLISKVSVDCVLASLVFGRLCYLPHNYPGQTFGARLTCYTPLLVLQFYPSVCLSVCHTSDPRLNGLKYRNIWLAPHSALMLED